MTTVTEKRLHPRSEIQEMLLKGNLRALLEKAGTLHGHYCPGLALGVKAVHVAFEKLKITENTGMEEVMAVVECNNCFVDGIQFVSGCTLGNNSLVYQDFGKTAATFYKRSETKAVRVCAKSFELPDEPEKEKQQANLLFERAVKKREPLSRKEQKRLKELWIRRSFKTVEVAGNTLFTISRVTSPSFHFAPIFDSQTCSVCSEKVMETKAVFRNGKPVCTPCAKAEYRMVVGKDIVIGEIGVA